MQVDLINDIHQFEQLKTDWESSYAADPHAHYFVSWMWLRGWFEITPHTWSVLAVRRKDSSSYVAFFPLIWRGLQIFKFGPIRALHMGGRPLAFYTGFVCLPDCVEEALAALAIYIQRQLNWDNFQIEQALDPRFDLFLENFSQDKFSVKQSPSMPSLYIPLPPTWDQYLQDLLGSTTRRSLRRSLRRVESCNEFRLTQAQKNNVDTDIGVLLELWQWRWGPKPMAHWHQHILRYLFDHNCAQLSVLRDGNTPMAALAVLVDQQKKTVYGYLTAYNAEYARYSPGKVICGYAIRDAIENGFEICDFLVGGDKYKFAVGAKQRGVTRNITIARRGLKSTVANITINLTRDSLGFVKQLLGKMKRIEILKKTWFWSRSHLQWASRQISKGIDRPYSD